MRCETNHTPIEFAGTACPLCHALQQVDLLRALVSDFGVTMLNALERGAVVIQACDAPGDVSGTRH